MQGNTSAETHFRSDSLLGREEQPTHIHFRLTVVSEAFRSKMQPARHRMIYALLKEEMERAGGIHALQLRTRTPEEGEREKAKEAAERGGTVADIE